MRSDFTALCRSVLAQDLVGQRLVVDGLVRCSIALTQGGLRPLDPDAAPGWPFGRFETGLPISGLDAIDTARARPFYANVGLDQDGKPVTTGGRVLHLVGAGRTLAEARTNAYGATASVSFPGMRYRPDIGRLQPLPAVRTMASPAPDQVAGIT
jgi:phosphoribosylamine--glycine ligase